MAKVVIYSKSHCPYCVRAKDLFKKKGVIYEEINMDDKFEGLDALKKRTGLQTVPQIFIDDKLVGGYTDLAALEQSGKLDPMLK